MSLSYRKRHARARRHLEEALTAVYRCVDNDCTPFQDCLKAAPADVRSRYERASEEVVIAEEAAINAGRAWRDKMGHVTWRL